MRRSFVIVLAALSAMGCDAVAEDVHVDEAPVTEGRVLTMEGGWRIASLPDQTDVDDYYVAPRAGRQPATIWVVSRPAAFQTTFTNDLTISRSDDGGQTFSKLGVIPDALPYAHITVAPSDDRIVYVSAGGVHGEFHVPDTSGQLWVSTDGGMTFTSRRPVVGRPEVPVVLSVHPTNPSDVVGATCEGVFRSVDQGRTFERLPNSVDRSAWGTCKTAYIHRGVNDPDTLYAEYYVGFRLEAHRSTDGGASWQELQGYGGEGPLGRRGGLSVHPSDANVLFSWSIDDSWVTSSDGGSSWGAQPSLVGTEIPPGSSEPMFDDPPYMFGEASNVAFETFTRSEATPYVVSNGVIKRWAPSTSGAGGGAFVDALSSPGEQIDRIRFAAYDSGVTGVVPVLLGITSARSSSPKLMIASLRVAAAQTPP